MACSTEDCVKEMYESPMVWVGLYIAGASLVCLIAFLIDLFNGFRTKKLWFPCKFFALNAAISAILAIALKIPSDLTAPMPSLIDQLVKLSGTALMSISLANFMPSLASMSDSQLFSNLMALALLIIPLISNICIQISTELIDKDLRILHIIILSCILLQFFLLISTAIASPTIKIKLDSAYKKATSSKASSKLIISNDELIRKHWVMTQMVIQSDISNKLTQFLMGLNEYYDNARQQILLMDPEPSINKAYSMLLSIERQREVQSLMIDQNENFAMQMRDTAIQHQRNQYNSKGKSKGQNTGKWIKTNNKDLFCQYCKSSGHVQDGCFKIIGYPDWFKGQRDSRSVKNSVNVVNTPFSNYEEQPESSNKWSNEDMIALKDLVKSCLSETKGKDTYSAGP